MAFVRICFQMLVLSLFLLTLLISLHLILWWGIRTARAHDWYPPECCSGKDCKPVECQFTEEMSLSGHGGPGIPIVVYREGGKRYYADKKHIKASPDDRCHICIAPGTLNMRCVWVPFHGM